MQTLTNPLYRRILIRLLFDWHIASILLTVMSALYLVAPWVIDQPVQYVLTTGTD